MAIRVTKKAWFWPQAVPRVGLDTDQLGGLDGHRRVHGPLLADRHRVAGCGEGNLSDCATRHTPGGLSADRRSARLRAPTRAMWTHRHGPP